MLGLIFGSFIATMAVRWPEGRSVLRGRSGCDACGKSLGPVELVPVASFVVQRGRCRACGGRIAPVHLWIEIIGLAVGISAGLAAPGWEGTAGAVFGWLLLALAALDLTAFWLPNVLTGALAVAGVLAGLAGIDPTFLDRGVGGVAGFGILWIVGTGYQAIRRREGLGGGDPKLMGAIGLWLGVRPLPLVLLGASVIGLAAVLALRLGGRKLGWSDRLPLGVPLAIAAWAMWLWAA